MSASPDPAGGGNFTTALKSQGILSLQRLNSVECIACRALQSLPQNKQKAAGAWGAHETLPAGSPWEPKRKQ